MRYHVVTIATVAESGSATWAGYSQAATDKQNGGNMSGFLARVDKNSKQTRSLAVAACSTIGYHSNI